MPLVLHDRRFDGLGTTVEPDGEGSVFLVETHAFSRRFGFEHQKVSETVEPKMVDLAPCIAFFIEENDIVKRGPVLRAVKASINVPPATLPALRIRTSALMERPHNKLSLQKETSQVRFRREPEMPVSVRQTQEERKARDETYADGESADS